MYSITLVQLCLLKSGKMHSKDPKMLLLILSTRTNVDFKSKHPVLTFVEFNLYISYILAIVISKKMLTAFSIIL